MLTRGETASFYLRLMVGNHFLQYFASYFMGAYIFQSRNTRLNIT